MRPRMRCAAKFVLSLVWSLMEVHSQTEFPYVSFMGETLSNHSYVDLTLVGDPESTGVGIDCHTDLTTCCSGTEGPHRGDWYFPDGIRLPFPGDGDIYEARGDQHVSLRRRNNANSPSGIYHCNITTTGEVARVYIGLYASGGDITIGDIEFTVDLSGASPQFTLTCISTGGPATNVTWTRDSVTVTEGTETVLDDPVTAQYNHTLSVTGRLGGLYTCTVANNKPSSDSSTISISEASAPTNLIATRESPTSVQVSWTPPSPLGDTTGYTIYYSNDNTTDSVDVSGGLTSSHTLNNLIASVTYDISIVATSQHLPSDVIHFLTPPNIMDTNITAISISLSWTSGDSEGVSYEVMWQRDTSVGCPDEDEGSTTITDGSTSYDIMGLEEDSSYNITVRASNTSGSSAVSNTVFAMTMEAAPSAAPTSVSVSAVTFSSITVQWGPVDCIHRNGDITGYSVQYRELGNQTLETTSVAGDFSGGMLIVSDLEPSTTYAIQVAAITNGLVGPYSNAVEQLTSVQVPVLSLTTTTATFISLSWTSGGSEGVSYEVMWQRDTSVGCSDEDEDNTTITDGSTSYDIMGLEEDSSYSITVRASNTAGSSEDSNTVTAMTMEAVPSAAPTSVSVSAVTSSSITVQWGPVDCIHHNGDIAGYDTCYTISDSTSSETCVSSSSDARESVITGLEPNTNYTIHIRATNGIGIGPFSASITIETDVISEDIHVPLTGFFVCTEWMMYFIGENIQEVTSAITSGLETSCKCQIAVDNFHNEHLVCSNESSNLLVYRAQIRGTSDMNSTAVVSLIENWIAITPTIRVLGVLIRVGEECTVNVTDLNSGVCSEPNELPTCNPTQANTSDRQTEQPVRSSSDSCTDIRVAVGIAVAVAVGVVIAASVVIVTIFRIIKSKKHQHNVSLNTPEELSVYSVENPMNFDGTTSPNVAYNITVTRGERDTDLDSSYDYIRTQSNPPRPRPLSSGYEIGTPENIRQMRIQKQLQEIESRETQKPQET